MSIAGCFSPRKLEKNVNVIHQEREKKMAFGLSVLIAAALLGLMSVQAASRSSRVEREVEYRRSLYTVVSVNFGPLGAMAEGAMPFNAAEAQKRADRLAFLAPMFKEAFPADSNGVARTAARSEIWTESVEFGKELQSFIEKTTLLAAVAKTNDIAKLKNAIEETGETCRSCHYKFRDSG
jgi:cytochrome c556